METLSSRATGTSCKMMSPPIAIAFGLLPADPSERPELNTSFFGRKYEPIRYLGNGISIGIHFKLNDSIRRKGIN